MNERFGEPLSPCPPSPPRRGRDRSKASCPAHGERLVNRAAPSCGHSLTGAGVTERRNIISSFDCWAVSSKTGHSPFTPPPPVLSRPMIRSPSRPCAADASCSISRAALPVRVLDFLDRERCEWICNDHGLFPCSGRSASSRSKSDSNKRSCTMRYFSNSLSAWAFASSALTLPASMRISRSQS